MNKEKRKRPVALSDWVPKIMKYFPKIMKLFKNFESCTELLNHAHTHTKKEKKRKEKKKRRLRKKRNKEWYNPMKNKRKLLVFRPLKTQLD